MVTFGLKTQKGFQLSTQPNLNLVTPLRHELLCQLFRMLRYQWISAKMKVCHPWQLE